jgi:hypothetical protein
MRIREGKNSDPRFGVKIPDPQHRNGGICTDLMSTLDDELVPDLPDVPGEGVPVHGAPAVSQRLAVAPQVQGCYATAGQSSQLLSCQAPGQTCCIWFWIIIYFLQLVS